MNEIGFLGDHNKSHSRKKREREKKMYDIYVLHTEIVLRWQNKLLSAFIWQLQLHMFGVRQVFGK